MDKDLADHDKTAQFEAMTLPHLDAAYNLARWLTRNAHDADDLVQNAYLRAFRFAGGFRGGDARAWLLTIVRHTYYTTMRDTQHQRAGLALDEMQEEPAQEGIADPADIVAARDTERDINAALRRLPPPFREVLVLKEMDDLSYKEIAQVTDTPIGTVMSRLARARKLLRAYLTHGEEHEL